MARALLVDDEAQIVLALQRGLGNEDFTFDTAESGEQALALAASGQPDLVIIDLGLPDLPGIEVIRRLRAWTNVPVIVLSGHGSEQAKIDALEAGADDYVTKPFGMGELRARVNAVLRRTQADPVADARSLRFGHLRVELDLRRVTLDGESVRLTNKEYALLEAFVSHPGKLLTHWWLLDRVWGRGVGEEGRQYLRVYVRQLRTKIGDDASAPRYVGTESGVGYRWLMDPD